MSSAAPTTEQTPVDPKRIKAFAVFFKRYMSISSLVVASLPIPVTSLGLIPTFDAQAKLLSVYTSLFCFLTLGFIFYSRHQLARLLFPEYYDQDTSERTNAYYALISDSLFSNLVIKKEERRLFFRIIRRGFWRKLVAFLPLFFIAASLTATFQYNDVLILNVREIVFYPPAAKNASGPASDGASEAQQPAAAAAGVKPQSTFKQILEGTDLNDIKYSSRLMILYIAIFMTAEAAFIMMAIKEYLQDLVGLTEMDLISGDKLRFKSRAQPVPVGGTVEMRVIVPPRD